jgi:hypothetical protein
MCRGQHVQKNASSATFPRYWTKRLLSLLHCEATPANVRGSVIRRITRERTGDSELDRAGWMRSDHASLERAFAESDSHRWRLRMTAKLPKYFTIPWLDRIVTRTNCHHDFRIAVFEWLFNLSVSLSFFFLDIEYWRANFWTFLHEIYYDPRVVIWRKFVPGFESINCLLDDSECWKRVPSPTLTR